MSDLNNQTLNELFVDKTRTAEGREKLAMAASTYIRKKLREVSFARKIITPQYVTRAELTRSVNHDTFVKIVDKEPDSKATAVGFRGESSVNYLEGPRFEIPLYPIYSEIFQKVEEELLAYEMPLTEVIERNSVLDLQEIEDKSFKLKVDQSITDSGRSITGSWATDGAVKPEDLRALFNLLDGNKLRAETVLMNIETFNRMMVVGKNNDTFGDGDLLDSITVEGYKQPTLFGRRIVVTNKTNILPEGDIYAFAAPEFIGQFLIMKDATFDIKKDWNVLSFRTSETIGIGIGNTKSMAKLTVS